MARAISKILFILGSYNFLASLECVRSYAWSKGHSEPDLSSVIVQVVEFSSIGAAASAIEIVSFQANLNLPKEINIDKPFLFFIRDTELKAVLFAGKYTNPDA